MLWLVYPLDDLPNVLMHRTTCLCGEKSTTKFALTYLQTGAPIARTIKKKAKNHQYEEQVLEALDFFFQFCL